MTFTGANLRSLRECVGLKQSELAAAMGVSGQTISNLENRETVPAYYVHAAAFVVDRNYAPARRFVQGKVGKCKSI